LRRRSILLNSSRATLFAGGLAVACASSAWATNDAIPGIDITIKTNPGGIAIIQTTTKANGEFTLRALAAGKYTIELGGKNIEAAKAAGATLSIVLQPVSRERPPATPQTYSVRTNAKGVLQADLIVPDGQVITYAGTLTR